MNQHDYSKSKFDAIGIDFGDNDFYSTFVPCLEILAKGLLYSSIKKEDITKEKICSFLNSISTGIYRLYQRDMEYTDEDFANKEYIKLGPEQILLGKEVDEYMTNPNNFANSEFFYIYEYPIGDGTAGAW